ncbi:MAG: GAF domain-containing protein [Phycisphaerales bacterium JB043]
MARDYTDVIRRCERIARDLTIEERAQAVSDILWDAFHARGVSWVGFYLARENTPEDERLVLVACRDKPACSPIGLHGVCGQGYVRGETRIVEDVRSLGEDYIACDPRDLSEIVIPIFDPASGACVGVLDLDSFEIGAFDESDDVSLREVLRASGFDVRSRVAPS